MATTPPQPNSDEWADFLQGKTPRIYSKNVPPKKPSPNKSSGYKLTGPMLSPGTLVPPQSPKRLPTEAEIKEKMFREMLDNYNKSLMTGNGTHTGTGGTGGVTGPGVGGGNGSFSGFDQLPSGSTNYDHFKAFLENEMDIRKKKDARLILFYGFNGMLAQRYSVITNMTREEITARMQIAADKLPWKIEEADEFQKAIDMFVGTPNALKEIPFNDALNVIRIGVQKEEEAFDEGDEVEFDDKCLDTCRPGQHKCGK